MRPFLAACWLVTLVVGSTLALWAPPFTMPDQLQPGCGWSLTPTMSRIVGVALLLAATAGWRLIRRAQQDRLSDTPYRWHLNQLLLLAGALLLLIAVSALAPYGPLDHTLLKTACPQPPLTQWANRLAGAQPHR
jgi:hypothetical protein